MPELTAEQIAAKPATEHTVAVNAKMRAHLPFEDRRSFEAFLVGTLAVPKFSVEALHAKLWANNGSKDVADFIIESIGPEKSELLWKKMNANSNESPAQLIGGHIGVLKSIAEFAGVVRGFKETDRICQLGRLLLQDLRDHPSDGLPEYLCPDIDDDVEDGDEDEWGVF